MRVNIYITYWAGKQKKTAYTHISTEMQAH